MKSSTNSSEHSPPLSAQDICSIIKTSGESSVSEFRFRDLYVRFDTPLERIRQEKALLVPSDTAISEIQRKVEVQSLLEEEIRTRDEQLAAMLIEDPLQAERLLIDDAVEDSNEGVDGAEET